MMDDAKKPDVGIRLTSDPDVTKIAQPQTEHARATVELPLRVVVVSDLTPQGADPDWSGSSRLMSVDRNNFAQLLERLAPSLTIEVPNKISGEPKTFDVDLAFSSLQAFHPEQVARQVPALAQLLEVRTLVNRVNKGDLELEAFRTRIVETGIDSDWADQLCEALSAPAREAPPRQAPPGSPAVSSKKPTDDEAVDRLLGMVDLGETDGKAEKPKRDEGPEASSFMGALVRAVTGASDATPKVERTVAEQLVYDVDQLISDQLNAVMGHPAFRRLESAWRGLKFIVDRTDFRKNIRLDVLAARKEALSEALYYQVLLPEHGDRTDRPPLSAVVLDFAFDHGRTDVALLEDVAETGGSLQAPVITSVDPSFFGVAEPGGLERLPSLRQHLEGPQYIEWNKLREKDDAKHLAVAVPPVLLRDQYGAEHPIDAFDFKETGQLWGGGALAVAVVMTASFGRTGWPTHLHGNGENRIENLPTWKSGRGHIPLAVQLPEHKQAELGDAGFVVLGCRPNRDSAYVAHAPTVHDTGTYESREATDAMQSHASLPCRLFVSRAAQFLLAFQGRIASGTPVDQVQSDLSSRLNALMSASGHAAPAGAVEIEHVPEVGLPDHEVFAIRLRPPKTILDESVSLVMQLQVRK